MLSPPDASHLGLQVAWLVLLAIPIGTVAWTITHEEIFREPREYCVRKSRTCRTLATRKFFYLFTCEYCFSHYVTIFFMLLTDFRLLLDDWRGYIISFFALVWMANVYMNLYARIRVELHSERAEIQVREKQIEKLSNEIETAKGKENPPPDAGNGGESRHGPA